MNPAKTIFLLLLIGGCSGPLDDPAAGQLRGRRAQSDYNDLNFAAGTMVLYEVQARVANACHPDVGADWQRQACRNKVAPKVVYRAQGASCASFSDLQQIRLGTLDDLMQGSADYRTGITLRYVSEKVGANTVWLMPPFPNNDTWSLPEGCDNLGSPYAVRDYLHVSGSLASRCIEAGKDEHDATPCWGNAELDALIQQAHGRGLKVMLDLALNHFGHNYLMYDYADFTPVRERIARGENLEGLWDYAGTYEEPLLHPQLLDTLQRLEELRQASPFHQANLAALEKRCPTLSGDALVRAYNIWRVALDWERQSFPCDPVYLEYGAPGFYLGRDSWDPAQAAGDNFTNNWVDVKFLFHHENNPSHRHEFVRQREYLFRVLNYWTSRGVDGFRLDHTTDGNSGMAPNEWKYLLSKVDYYAWRRGQARPVYLAEEFGDQMGMNHVVDAMTEGYVGDMTGRGGIIKDAGRVESVLHNMDRFGGHAFVMTALETHDERRLLDGTGFDIWTGAGFFGIGAGTRSTPMLLMGQEFGEPWALSFRRSDFLRGRFVGSANYNPSGDALAAYYRTLITLRLDDRNRALYSPGYAFLRTRDGNAADPRIFAQVKWSHDGNVVFVFHNLWTQDVAQSYYIDPQLADTLLIRDELSYRLWDVISGQQKGPCQRGADLKWNFYVSMDAGTRAQWLRLETCN